MAMPGPRGPQPPRPPKAPSMGEHSGGRIKELNSTPTPTKTGGPRGAYSGSDAGGGNLGTFTGSGNPYKIGPTAPDVSENQRGGRGTRFYDAYTIKVDGIPGPQTLSAAYGGGAASKALGGSSSTYGGRDHLENGISGLRPGSSGPEVGKWQQYLRNSGMYRGKIDSNFGPMTFNATRNFQKNYNANVTKDYYAIPKAAVPGQLVR